MQAAKDKILESAKGTETLQIVRERSCGTTTADTEKTIFSQSKDDSLKKSILKGTFANVTIRKRKPDDEITGSGKLKHAKAVGDILEHYSEHSPQTKMRNERSLKKIVFWHFFVSAPKKFKRPAIGQF